MTITAPSSRDGTSLPQSFTVCVSANPEERGRVAAALDGEGLLVLVPDAQMAVDLLAQAAAQARFPDDLDEVVRLGRLEVDHRRATCAWDHVARRVAPRARGARLPGRIARRGLELRAAARAAWGTRYSATATASTHWSRDFAASSPRPASSSTSSRCAGSASSSCRSCGRRRAETTRLRDGDPSAG